jgi:hypothetical protein
MNASWRKSATNLAAQFAIQNGVPRTQIRRFCAAHILSLHSGIFAAPDIHRRQWPLIDEDLPLCYACGAASRICLK